MAGKSSAPKMFAILLVSLCIFSVIRQSDAARMTQEVIGSPARVPLPTLPSPPRVICPACVCCRPAPPGGCCRCCNAPIEEQSTKP